MKQWWLSLQPRERRLVGGGGVLLALLALYTLVWEPYASEREALEQRVAAQRELLTWMEQAAQEVRALRGSAAPVADTSGQSLLALVDSTAKAQGLGKTVTRVQPEGTGSVRVWLEQAPFDRMLVWLDTLTGKYGIRVGGVVAERTDTPGLANARVVLEAAR